MTLQLIDVPKLGSSPGTIIQLVLLITFTTRKPTHGLDHLIMVRIIEKGPCIIMVPVLSHLTLPPFGRKQCEVADCLCIVPQSLSQIQQV